MMNPLRYVSKALFDKKLNETGPSLTFRRLCTSRHVDDLQVLVTFALAAFALAFYMQTNGVSMSAAHKGEVGAAPASTSDNIPYLAGITAATATVLSWAYQIGNKRLGVVDLFATEISTICRVCLVVNFAGLSLNKVNEEKPSSVTKRRPAPPFTSQEQYTPVYDGSVAELQSLDFDVVRNVTSFYTYRKTMLDIMRKIAGSNNFDNGGASTQMIYMQFLMYESARLAIYDLIEFEPDRSEALINVLCCELTLFPFLMLKYKDDFKGERLKLRVEEYDRIVNEVYHNSMANFHKNWQKARTSAPAMKAIYDKMKEEILPAIS